MPRERPREVCMHMQLTHVLNKHVGLSTKENALMPVETHLRFGDRHQHGCKYVKLRKL